MTEVRADRQLRSGGSLWGPERVEAGLSLRELERRTGINAGFLSRMEHGRMVPTSTEFHLVMAALEAWRREHDNAPEGVDG